MKKTSITITWEEDKLTGAVLSSSGVRRQGLLHGGEDSANPYQIYGTKKRELVTAIKTASGAHDWSCEILSGGESVVFDGLAYDVGEVRLHLKAGQAPGESEAVLRSEAAGAEIRLRCVLLEDGSLLVTEHQAQLREKPEENATENQNEEPVPAAAEAAVQVSAEATGETGN